MSIEYNGYQFSESDGLGGYTLSNGVRLKPLIPEAEEFSSIRELARYEMDAAWVLGRIARIFTGDIGALVGFEKSFGVFEVEASRGGNNTSFICSDRYGAAEIWFPDGAERDEEAANAFWALLLEEPYAIDDYDAEWCDFSGGVGGWLFGVADGEAWARKAQSRDEESGEEGENDDLDYDEYQDLSSQFES